MILVRHGETEGNVAKLLDTRLPGLALTERGVAQAKSFGSTLPGPPAGLFSSAALRARETAAQIEAVTGVAAQVLDDMFEVQAGDLEGRSGADALGAFHDIYRSWHEGDLDRRIPGGESGTDVLDRVVPVLDRLRTDYLDNATGDILVVSHGALMRLVGRVVGGVTPPFSTDNHLDNTETIELVPRAGGWDCVRWGRFTPPFGSGAHTETDDPMG
ncbi:histidine phosphatase family protein [Nocardia stercoris]|uniref:Histidine phosphatase family protein n=1 Tax=Nocardia stercoris TaxID=2483361 RepID=A0A3M2LI37_9NOCA|nr:histidine phosphatase family protein [Nocardia stercoris]